MTGYPAFVCDQEHDVYRVKYDEVFAFSRRHANWKELKQRGVYEEP